MYAHIVHHGLLKVLIISDSADVFPIFRLLPDFLAKWRVEGKAMHAWYVVRRLTLHVRKTHCLRIGRWTYLAVCLTSTKPMSREA